MTSPTFTQRIFSKQGGVTMSSPTTKGKRKPLTPLAYLLAVVNDEGATPSRRDYAAVCALPYCHPRVGAVGKKARAAEAAKMAGEGSEWADDLRVDVYPRQ